MSKTKSVVENLLNKKPIVSIPLKYKFNKIEMDNTFLTCPVDDYT